MGAIHIKNFPDDLYDALRKLAKRHRRPISAEALALLEEHMRNEKEIEARRNAIRRLKNLKFTSTSDTPMPDSLDMIREDRDR